jgi:hypothetical protein
MSKSTVTGRHKVAAFAVLAAALCVGYHLKQVPPTYADSAPIAFTAAPPLSHNPRRDFRDSLISTEIMMSQDLSSSTTESEIAAAGGTARFELMPFNLYDIQYPNFAIPMATLTATSASAADARRTFAIVRSYLVRRVATLQAQAHVSTMYRLGVDQADQASLTRQVGSRVRTLAALSVLTIIAMITTAALVDRLPVHPSRLAGRTGKKHGRQYSNA